MRKNISRLGVKVMGCYDFYLVLPVVNVYPDADLGTLAAKFVSVFGEQTAVSALYMLYQGK